MSTDIVDLSAGSIAQEISKKSISCKDVTTAFLERIDELNPVLNAVCTLNDQALDQAVDGHASHRTHVFSKLIN